MSLIVDGTNGVTFNDSSLQGAAASPYVLKNRIINGDMRIDQRNAGASTTPTTDNTYTLDRWRVGISQSSKFSIQQNAGSVTPPAGFNNYLGVTSLSSYSVGSGDYFLLEEKIEGFNVADLGWGAVGASTVTLSFWVRSSLTGTFGGVFRNSAENRSYPFSYTISSANTWEQKTVTVSGDTSGTWLKTNGTGLAVAFSLGMGSSVSGTAGAWVSANLGSVTGATSVVGTNGATWYITGVQLEIGSTATPFERRLYNQELANCQRYYWEMARGSLGTSGAYAWLGTGYFYSPSQYNLPVMFPVTMRTLPSVVSSNSANHFGIDRAAGIIYFSTFNIFQPSIYGTLIYQGTLSGSGTAGLAAGVFTNAAAAYVAFSAEL